MRTVSSIAIFCSSSDLARLSFKRDAYHLGELIAQGGYRLVYGDGGIGLMAAVADGALSRGGHVTGVIPRFMVDQGWNNQRSSQTIITDSMHERKATIFRISDAMVALPGGIGTFDELCECITWKQLGLHSCPIVILNTDGYYNTLLDCFSLMVQENLMRPIHQDMYTVVNTPDEVIPAILNAPQWDSSIRKMAKI